MLGAAQYRTNTDINQSRDMVSPATQPHSVTAFQRMNRETHMITKTRVIESVACLAIAVALTGLPAWSQAGERDSNQKRVVSYVGLDLNSPAGARILYSRLLLAAYAVCEDPHSVRTRVLTPSHPCMRKAMRDAVTTVNRPQLTQLYAAHYNSPPPGSDLGISVARAEQK